MRWVCVNCLDCSTAGSEEILDLIPHFNIQEIFLTTGDIEDGACVALTFTGNLLDEVLSKEMTRYLLLKLSQRNKLTKKSAFFTYIEKCTPSFYAIIRPENFYL